MIKLLRDQIAVDPIYDSDYYNPSSQLIQIPDIAKERCDQGIIKYITPGAQELGLCIGQHVIFSGYTGTTIGVDGEILIIMHGKFVKAIIDIDNYPVPGLFHRGKIHGKILFGSIEESINRLVEGKVSTEDAISLIVREVGNYINSILIPASYETSIPLIAQAYKHFIGRRVNVKKEEHKEQMDAFDGDR